MTRALSLGVAAVVALMTLALAPAATRPAPQRSGDYDVKGEFLYNFLSFIDWPPSSRPEPEAPFRICILGADPFGAGLDARVRDERIDGHPIAIKRLKEDRLAASCQILFVSHIDDTRIEAVVRATAHRGVLIVGDTDRILDLCGAIGFVVEGQRVRFDVNLAALDKAGLEASSQLLRVARAASRGYRGCR